jgi:hypothetical protein
MLDKPRNIISKCHSCFTDHETMNNETGIGVHHYTEHKKFPMTFFLDFIRLICTLSIIVDK